MTQISLIVNSMPRDLTEFAFFLAVGFTAGSMGLIWLRLRGLVRIIFNTKLFDSILIKLLDWKYWLHRKIKSRPPIEFNQFNNG